MLFQIFGAVEESTSIGFPVGQKQDVDVRTRVRCRGSDLPASVQTAEMRAAV